MAVAPKRLKENIQDLNADYVVAGSLTEVDNLIINILESKFEKIKTIGHYTLYKNID